MQPAPVVTSRREFLLGAVAAAAAPPGPRPNILFIITDDQRYDAFSASGFGGMLSFLKTPHMDRLATEGVHFRNAFVTTSLCSPSRASMLTGQYAHTHGVNSTDLGRDLKPGARIFPQLLQQAGYETGLIGKWHLGKDSELPKPGFDFWAAFRELGAYFDPVLNVNGTRTPTHGYITDILTDYAIDFIRRPRQHPFYLQLAHLAPHDPVSPPEDLKHLFDDVDIPYPASFYERQDDKPSWYLNFHDHDFFHTKLHPRATFHQYVKDYCRCLVAVDRNLGRLLKVLDDTGLSRNTVIIYMGDNGHFLTEHQFFSKMIMYEESVRVPLLVRYPGVGLRGRKRDEFVLNVDIAETALEIAGAAIPKNMEGRSFLPLVCGQKPADWRKSFLYEFDDGWGLPPLEGVRTADGWQYARYTDWEQLYYIPEDPCQTRNLAADPKYGARKQELFRELQRLGGGRPLLRGPSAYKRRSEPVHTPHPPGFNEQ